MTMQTDVLSATRTTDGTLVAGPARIKGILLTTTTTAGSIVLKDGGSSGTARITINTPAVAEIFNSLLPAEGVRFTTDVYLDTTDVASVTVFYG
jgi:hypothetical protein